MNVEKLYFKDNTSYFIHITDTHYKIVRYINIYLKEDFLDSYILEKVKESRDLVYDLRVKQYEHFKES